MRVAKKPLRNLVGRMSTDSEIFTNVRLKLRGPRWTEVLTMRLIDVDELSVGRFVSVRTETAGGPVVENFRLCEVVM